jgi:hypothetical protein
VKLKKINTRVESHRLTPVMCVLSVYEIEPFSCLLQWITTSAGSLFIAALISP